MRELPDDVAGAEALLTIPREQIWPNPENAPGLEGQPRARIVETVEATER